MKNFKRFCVWTMTGWLGVAMAHADYAKGLTMFQIYGGGAGLGGRYGNRVWMTMNRDLPTAEGSSEGSSFIFRATRWLSA